jgi:Tfp pilus assembly protein PilV
MDEMMMSAPGQLRRRPHCGLAHCGLARRGFTLIETAITTVIIGVGTVAMMALLAAGTNSNQQTATLTTAIDLADDIHELCDQTSYPSSGTSWGMPVGQTIANIFSSGNTSWLNQQTFSPPIDATANAINGMGSWSQSVTVNNVSPTNLTTTLSPNAATNPMSLVTVTISHDGQQIYQNSWLTASQ